MPNKETNTPPILAPKAAGQPAPDCKRVAKQVIPGHVVVAGETNQPQVLGPIPYEFVA